MSKAFTKESDEGPFNEVIPEPKDPLPTGTKNYVTPEGAQALRAELERLEQVVRPQLLGAKTPRGGKVTAVDGESLSPKTQEQDSVHFGATVSVADAAGDERVYKIVGVDESDPAQGRVSFISPIGNALISAREGDSVRVELPDGSVELEVLDIKYV
jgi:transcription elongation factor GreB